MRVSVVIPTLSRPELLGEALQSLALQTYGDWEAVVVDDGSEPQLTAGQVARIVGERFQLLRHSQSVGTAVAKNTGVTAATGQLITILDDDDLLEPTALRSIVNVFETQLDVDCLFLNIEPFGQFAADASANQNAALKKVLSRAASRRQGDVLTFGAGLFEALLRTTPIAMQRPVARPAVWRKVGAFTPGIMCPEPAWSARAALHCSTALLASPVYKWRVDGQNHASRPAMRSVASNSILEDRLLLLRSGSIGDRRDLRVLQRSIATLLLDQAIDSLLRGNRVEAARRLQRSLRFDVGLRSAKTAVRLMLPVAGLRRAPGPQ